MGHRVAILILVMTAACSTTASTTQPAITATTITPTTITPTTMSGEVTDSTATTMHSGKAETADSALTLLNDTPVVEPADSENYTNPGAIVVHDGIYHMLRNSFSEWPGASRTDHLVSSDGITWEAVPGGPVITGEDVPFGDNNAFPMSLIVDGDEWVAYLYTYDGQSVPAMIGRATAADPDGPWTVDPDPVLVPGDEGAWDSLQVREPSVVKIGDQWFMYYTGSDGPVAAIGLATSDDGVTWIKRDEPVLTGEQLWWDLGSVGCPQVVSTAHGFVMTYDAVGRGTFATGLATSPDGIAWTPWDANPLITEATAPSGQQIWQSELVDADGRLRWWLEVGSGASRTDIYVYEISSDVLANPPQPSFTVESQVAGSSVILRVGGVGLGIGFESGSADRRLLHPHAYIDRDPPTDGEYVALDDPTIAHSATGTIVLTDLEAGEHTFWVVGADGIDNVVTPPDPIRVDVPIE